MHVSDAHRWPGTRVRLPDDHRLVAPDAHGAMAIAAGARNAIRQRAR
jgi:hypothetical protein